MEKEIENSLKFWNEAYKGEESEVLKEEDYVLQKEMQLIFNTLLDKCPVILEYGCGEGRMLYTAAHCKKSQKLYGVEKGEYIVEYLNGMIKANHFENDIKIIDGGLKALDKDGRFVNFKDNMYSYQGVMRIRECTTDEWRKWFSPYFTEEMYADVPYQYQPSLTDCSC